MASVFQINFNIMLKIKEKHFIKMMLMLTWIVFPKKCESCNDLGWGKSKDTRVCWVNIVYGMDRKAKKVALSFE